jgi:Uma2 family endonuclease
MEIPLAQRLLTVDDYQKMVEAGILTEDDRVELLEGKIIEMSPAGKRHAAMVKRLTAFFYRILGEKVTIGVQDPVIAGRYSMPEPDLAILKYRSDFYEHSHPKSSDILLVIEVADSSLDKDRRVKSPLYAAAGIPEYWIIDLERDQVEVCREPAGKEYLSTQVLKPGDTIQLPAWGVEVRLNELFVA